MNRGGVVGGGLPKAPSGFPLMISGGGWEKPARERDAGGRWGAPPARGGVPVLPSPARPGAWGGRVPLRAAPASAPPLGTRAASPGSIPAWLGRAGAGPGEPEAAGAPGCVFAGRAAAGCRAGQGGRDLAARQGHGHGKICSILEAAAAPRVLCLEHVSCSPAPAESPVRAGGSAGSVPGGSAGAADSTVPRGGAGGSVPRRRGDAEDAGSGFAEPQLFLPAAGSRRRTTWHRGRSRRDRAVVTGLTESRNPSR